MDLIIAELNKERHDRDSFDCGIDALNFFLKLHASQNQVKNISRSYVAVSPDDAKNSKAVVGYYTITAGQIDCAQLPTSVRTKLPKHPVPIARIARLAVDKKHHGQGVGGHLLYDALIRILELAGKIGIFAVVVDAKNDSARMFYKKYGFSELEDSQLTLFLPIETVRSI